MKQWIIATAALALAACGEATATTDSVAVESTASAEERTEESAAPAAIPDDVAAKEVAAKWGFNGYIACGHAMIGQTAAAINSRNPGNVQAVQVIMDFMSKVKPIVHPVPDMSLIDAAMQSYSFEHANESPATSAMRADQCVRDILDAKTA